PVEGGVDRKVDIFAPSGAEVARCVERLVVLVEDEDSVLELADEVIAKFEPNLALREDRVLDQQAAFPGALGLEIGVAAVDPAHRQLGGADEIEEVELRHRAAQDRLRMPAAARLPVERQARLQELQ